MKKLRKLINDKSKPLVVPGVYDAIGAKIAQKVGFEAMFQTGLWYICHIVRNARLWIYWII